MYIANAPKEAQAKLKELRAAIKQVTPDAAESIGYKMPHSSCHGRLVYFASMKGYIGYTCARPSLASMHANSQCIRPRSQRSDFRLIGKNQHLAVAQRLDVIGIGWATPAAFLSRMPGLQLHGAGLGGDQRGARPQIILALRQQMPAEHSELASYGDRSDLMAASGADAHQKGMQRTGRLGRRPGRLDQHGACVTAADLADATVMGGSQPRLPDPGVQSEMAHQLLRAVEPADIADRRHDPSARQIYAGDRHLFIRYSLACAAPNDIGVCRHRFHFREKGTGW